jgi:predicted phosphodiesterase
MGTYVIGDIHGCLDAWLKLRDKIEQQDKCANFILVGDIIDRGPQVVDMVSWAMYNINNNGGKYQMIMGNHEFEKVEWLHDQAKVGQTNPEYLVTLYDRYGYTYEFNRVNEAQAFVDSIKWFNTLPFYKELMINNKRIVVAHGNIPKSAVNSKTNTILQNLDYKTKTNIVWDRPVNGFKSLKDTYLVHGHTPTVMEDAFSLDNYSSEKLGRIIREKRRFNVDCGLVYSKYFKNCNLAALRLEDFEEFYLYE